MEEGGQERKAEQELRGIRETGEGMDEQGTDRNTNTAAKEKRGERRRG